MIRIYIWGKKSKKSEKSWKPKIALGVVMIAFCSVASLAADTITGVVRNQTHGRPAAGDEVLLFRVDQGMQEEARTRTDSQGSFSLELRNPHKPHLVRVIYQGVNYDREASPGNTISIDVFDATAKVQGLTGGLEIIRAGTNGNHLHVSDMIEIRNDSSPPVTQASERTFEVYLPADAKMDSVLAAGPENIGVVISATPVRGESGHYTVNYPLEPGATKFAFNYDLPYDGHATFRTKSLYPLQQLAVMTPPTMRFTSRSPAFQVLPAGNDRYRVEAAQQVKAGEGPEFEVSGVGSLPSMQAQVHAPPKPPAGALTAPALSTPGNAELQAATALRTVPVSRPSARSLGWQGWVLAVGAVSLLGVCGLLLWGRHRVSANARTTDVPKTEQAGQTSALPVQALKEELFQLEIDRIRGTVSGEEYASARQALEGTIEWALARSGTRSG